MQQRKINASFTIELSQLERLDALSQRTRVPKSEIVRNALDRELAKHEKEQAVAVEAASNGRHVAVAGAGRRKKTSRSA